MFLGPGSGAVESLPELRCKNFSLTPVAHNKLLGVVIDSKLNWAEHLRHTITKIDRKIGAFFRAQRLLNMHARKRFLTSVVLPDSNHCCQVFASALKVASPRSWSCWNVKVSEFVLGLDERILAVRSITLLESCSCANVGLCGYYMCNFWSDKRRSTTVNKLSKDNQHTLHRTRSDCSNAPCQASP